MWSPTMKPRMRCRASSLGTGAGTLPPSRNRTSASSASSRADAARSPSTPPSGSTSRAGSGRRSSRSTDRSPVAYATAASRGTTRAWVSASRMASSSASTGSGGCENRIPGLCHASDRETPAGDRPLPPDPEGDFGAKLSCAPVPFVVMDDERRSLDEEAMTMRYLALLGGDESLQPGPGTPEFDAVLERYRQFHEKNDEAILAGEALQPSITATTVRHRDGQPLVTSGPFAETVEALGDAIELARQIPAASDGWVAVRPMVEWFDRSAGVEAGDGDPPVPGPPPEGPRFLALIYGRETDGDVPDTPQWG